MEDTHPNRQPNPTPQCQYQPNLNVSPPRENPHYDPVHDSTSWSPNNPSSHTQSRPTFGQPHPFSPWDAGQYAPAHSWQGQNEVHQTPQSNYWDPNSERTQNGPMGGMMNSHWNDLRNELRPFEPMSFGYGSYHAPPSTNNNNPNSTTNNNTMSSNGGTSARTPSALAPSFNPPQPFTMRAGSSSQHVIQQEVSRSRPSRTELTPSSHPIAHATAGRAAHILATPELTTGRPSKHLILAHNYEC